MDSTISSTTRVTASTWLLSLGPGSPSRPDRGLRERQGTSGFAPRLPVNITVWRLPFRYAGAGCGSRSPRTPPPTGSSTATRSRSSMTGSSAVSRPRSRLSDRRKGSSSEPPTTVRSGAAPASDCQMTRRQPDYPALKQAVALVRLGALASPKGYVQRAELTKIRNPAHL